MDEEEAQKPRVFGLSRNVVSMGVVSFLNDLSSDMMYPFIPIFLTSVLGAGAAFMGLVEGIADGTASVCKLFSGHMSDRLHTRKPFVVLGYSISALTKPALAFATRPWHVLGVRFFDRVGKGIRDAPRDTLISFSTSRARMGRAFGFHRAADTAGAALGPLAALLFLPLLGYNLRSLFLVSFVASFFAVLTVIFMVREVKPKVEHDDRLLSQFIPLESVPRQFSLKDKSPSKFTLREFRTPFLIFLAASTLFALARGSDAFLLLRAQGLGATLMLFPLLYGVSNIVFALLSTPAGMLSDKIGHRNTFMIGMILFAGTYVAFSLASSMAILWVLFAAYGCYQALTDGVGRAIVADLVEEDARATAFGVYSACTGFALLPASIIFGFLWEWFGPAISFQYGAGLTVLALVLFIVLRLRNKGFAEKIRGLLPNMLS